MKKLHLLLLSVTLCVFSACHNDIWDAIDGLDSRVTKLEELCKEMNTNITSLQTIVDVLQANDYITGIVEIKKDGKVIGYTITFGKHDPITIYHGQDGKDGADGKDGQDGQNGTDGKDGITPVIGVAQDTDGVYYWTLNGEWLLDDNGNKLPVSGKDGQNGTNGSNGQDGADGKDGQDGEDGKDGVDGQDGKDGITPQLKIEEGYWYISYDNGATWTQLGKATGEDGKDGADGQDGQNGTNGKDGQNGDSMFQSVTQDENYVYFTLADGTVIKIAKGSGSNDQPNSEFIFTITYDPNGGEGVMEKDTFYYGRTSQIHTCEYARNTYAFVCWNTNPNGSGASYLPYDNVIIEKNIILYAQWEAVPLYVDLGLSVKWATCNIGANSPEQCGEYYAWGEVETKSIYNLDTYKWSVGGDLTKYNDHYTLGVVDNKYTLDLSDDAAYVNVSNDCRMPTYNEIGELCNLCIWTQSVHNGVKGYDVTGPNGKSIFLPYTNDEKQGIYWSNRVDSYTCDCALALYFSNTEILASYGRGREYGCCIRPVYP